MTSTTLDPSATEGSTPPTPPPPIEVIGYKTFWNATDNHGQLWILFADETGQLFDMETPQEMMMLVDLLRNEKPIYYDRKYNLITTGLEPVGEGENDAS